MIVQRITLSYGTKIISQVIRIVATIFIARIVGPTVFGTIAWAIAFAGMFMPIGNLGFTTAHKKLVSEGQDLGNCISTYHGIIKITYSILAVVYFSTVLLMRYLFNVEFESETHFHVLLIIGAAIMLDGGVTILSATFVARLEIAKISIPSLITQFLKQLFHIIVVLIGLRVIGLSIVNLCAGALLFSIYYRMQRKYQRGKYDPVLAKKYFNIAAAMFVVVISQGFLRTLGQVILQFFTDTTQVGYYTAGFRIGGFLLMMAGTLGSLFLPLFSKAIAEGDLVSIRRRVYMSERFTYIFIMPAMILLSVESDPIVRLVLGEQYLPAIPILALVNLAMIMPIINIPYYNVIVGLGRFKHAAVINVISVIILVVFAVIGSAPQFLNLGAVGITFGLIGYHLFQTVTYMYYAHGKYQIVNSLRNFKYIIFGLGFYFLAREIFRGGYTPGQYLFPAIYAIGFMTFVYSFYFIFKWLDARDIALLSEIFDVRKLKSYISSEMNDRQDGS